MSLPFLIWLQIIESAVFSLLLQALTFITAALAIFIAYKNLRGFRTTQFIQTHMNLIHLEKDLRIKRTTLKKAAFEYAKVTNITIKKEYDPELIRQKSIEKDIAFELYISAADKLASLMSTKQFKEQQKTEN